jgi:putative transposase
MESTEFKQMQAKALEQLRTGQSLTGKDGVFAPLIKKFIEEVLEGEISHYLDEMSG